jgi:hypothetical protein
VLSDVGIEGWMRLRHFADSAGPSYSRWIQNSWQVLFYGMAPLFWAVGYLRLRELEV